MRSKTLRITVSLAITAIMVGGSFYWLQNSHTLQQSTVSPHSNTTTTPESAVTRTPNEIQKYLPTNAVNVKTYRGDFNGDSKTDAVVLYEIKNVILDNSGFQGDKQYLEVYLYDPHTNTYNKKRTDQGTPLLSWTIDEPMIADFDHDGKSEIAIQKTDVGSSAYKSYYVMEYRNEKIIDLPIEKKVQNKTWTEGKEGIIVENNKLTRIILTYTEGDLPCCPTGPIIKTTWALRNGKFVVDKETITYPLADQVDYVTNPLYHFSFASTGAVNADTISKVITIIDHSKDTTSDTANTPWRNRLNHKSQYKPGSTCLPEDVSTVTGNDLSQIKCTVVSVSPNFIIKNTSPDSVDYTVVTNTLELTFSFIQDNPLTMEVINNTLKFAQ